MTQDDLDTIESHLGITLPPEYRAFLQNIPPPILQAYGGDTLFTDPHDVIEETQNKRFGELVETPFHHDYVIVGAPGNGDFFCLDLSQDPAPVLEFDHETATFKTLAHSFDSWTRTLIRSLKT